MPSAIRTGALISVLIASLGCGGNRPLGDGSSEASASGEGSTTTDAGATAGSTGGSVGEVGSDDEGSSDDPCLTPGIRGRVLDASTGEPMEFWGTVFGPYLEDGAYSHASIPTDSDGRFFVEPFHGAGQYGFEFVRPPDAGSVSLVAHERFEAYECEVVDVGELYWHHGEIGLLWSEGTPLDIVVDENLTLHAPPTGVSAIGKEEIWLGGKRLDPSEFLSATYAPNEIPVAQYLLGHAHARAEAEPFRAVLTGDFGQAPGTPLRVYILNYFETAPELLGEFVAGDANAVEISLSEIENLHIVRVE